MGHFMGIIYLVLWFSSILSGYAMFYCPLLPVLLVSNKLYRRIGDFFMAFWQMYPAALLHFLFGCKILISGDPIDANESCLIVMNHRTRTDWNFFWPAVFGNTFSPNRWFYPTKFVLKDSIRHAPAVGWMMQLGGYIFIKRQWDQDKFILSDAVNYFADLKWKFNVLIFPEGTDFTAKTKSASDRFANANNLPIYENVLHPRTQGFVHIAREMSERQVLQAVYDVTIWYEDLVPQTELSLFSGRFPKVVRLHFQKYHLTDRNPEALRQFLVHLWARKESFLGGPKNDVNGSRNFAAQRMSDLYLAMIFWTLLPLLEIFLVIRSPWLLWICLGHTMFLLFVNKFASGFQPFEIWMHRLRSANPGSP